jgi:threonylcarbamoyladenosine tRNA methylthiotransferase MtaB
LSNTLLYSELQKSVSFYTLGCKLNYSETSTIGRKFTDSGFQIKPFEEGADYVVINTCSVTDHADKKTKNLVKTAINLNAEAKVIIIGCYAQLKPEEITNIPGVSLVLGASEKFDIIDYIAKNELDTSSKYFNSHIKEALEFNLAYSAGDRTRTFLKIQDGCDYFCAFCTIPLARGRSRSGTVSQVLQSVQEIADRGVKEIVLTGVNTGDFQTEDGDNFLSLIKQLDNSQGIERFRISSIEPNLLTDEIIHFVAQSKKFVPHFHIPLQSGSDKILQLMRRRYDVSHYASRINLIKSLMPNACIGVDVIVGFPSESEEDFEQTYQFIHSLDVSYLHVFTYSERANTTALRISGRIPNRIRSERNKRLTILSDKKKRAFYAQNEGKSAQVLWEGQDSDGFQYGFTSNYIKAKRVFDSNQVNQIEQVRLSEVSSDCIMNIYE